MVLTFANGGTPVGNDPYTGVTYTDGTGLLTLIQSTLNTAGWVTISGTPAAPPMLMEGDLGGDKTYMQFNITGTSDRLEIRGSDDNLATNLSPANIVDFAFVPGQNNTLFITADTFAGCIASFPFSGNAAILHFGFCDRLDSTDADAIYVGRVMTAVPNSVNPDLSNDYTNSYGNCFVKVARHDGTTLWLRLSDRYTDSNTGDFITSTSLAIPYYTTFNRTSGVHMHNSSSSIDSQNVTNIGYYAHIGGNEPGTNRPLLGDYYYLEPRQVASAYGNSLGTGVNPTLYLRGKIHFAVTGLSHVLPLTQWNGASGNVYVGGGAGYQGMRIA